MLEPNDLELLTAYRHRGDDAAFARLVERHASWIFAAAKRRLTDTHLADDATQAVFVVLVAKSADLVEGQRGSLSAWLFHVMHFTCGRINRSRLRQAKHEWEAQHVRKQNDAPSYADAKLVGLLEDSISQLPKLERELIVRRFYQRQRLVDIGIETGMSTEAARKRVSRSLVRVRELMLRDGIAVIPDALLRGTQCRRGAGHDADIKAGQTRVRSILKETQYMKAETTAPEGGHQMISAEFLVADVEANLIFFEKLGFPRRFVDQPDAAGRVPRASFTAGKMGKIWIRRAEVGEIQPSPSINVFFWVDGGPEGLVAHRQKLKRAGLSVTSVIDEHGLPNFNVTTPDGYSIAFFTVYVPPGQPPVPLVL